MRANLAPSSYVEGGAGLIDDVDVTVKESSFLLYNYGGKRVDAPTVVALGLVVTDPTGDDHEIYLGAGKTSIDNLAPSTDGEVPAADGKGNFLCVTNPDKPGIIAGSNLGKFNASLVNAGFPEARLNDGASVLVGLQFHLKRLAANRGGLNRVGKSGQKQDDTYVAVTKIIKLPWEAGASATPAKAASATTVKPNGAATTVAAPAASSTEGDALIVDAIMSTLLGATDNRLPKAKLATEVFNALKNGDEAQKAISKQAGQKVLSDAFLKSQSSLKLEGGVVSLA